MREPSVLLVAIVANLTSGCEVYQAPNKIHELEGRVTELSAQVAALRGEAPAAGSAHGAPADAKALQREPEHAEHKPAVAADHAEKPADKTVEKAAEKTKAKAPEPKAPEPPKEKKVEKPHWGYEGTNGPERWAALDPGWSACSDGHAQSPIDIEPHAAKATPIQFHYRPTAASVVDNGHTLQVNLAPSSTIEIDGQMYGLVQFHIHTPSEHTLAGERYPLEVHLVHKSSAGKLAVIGVLYDTGASSAALDPVFAKWPQKLDAETKLSMPFDPTLLLPENRGVFRYQGSLTTPPCTEEVVWNVMRRSMTDSKGHLAVVAKHYKNNARPVQALGQRKVE